MKKNCSSGRFSEYLTIRRKLILKMKLIIILICILGLTGSYASVYSQQTKLDLNVKKMAVKDVLKLIEDQSEFSFMYNASKIDVYRKIDLNVEKSSVEDVLKKIFPGEDFFYKIIDRNIIISVSSEANGTESGQQQKTVTGKVTDSSGIPLPGVTVVLKGTTTGIITDANGNYSLSNIPANASLKFSFIGMKSQEVEVGGKTTVNVKMDEETIGIEEVVAIGYGTIGKKEVSSSIVSVNKEDFIQTAVSSPMELVTGKIAGLNVNSTETANPNSSPSLQIRGATSLSAGNNPLIVINGIPGGNLQSISPQDIESITVLKDGASSAIYGTRGANGVILVTTKQGTAGAEKFSATYESWFGVNFLKNIPRLLTADEFRKYNRGFDYGGNTDWYRAIMNDFIYDDNQYVSFNGSTSKGWYNVSLNYVNSLGMEKGNSRKEYGGRFDIMQKILNNRVEFTASVNIRKATADRRGSGFGFNIMTRNPTIPIYNEDGSYYHTESLANVRNPVEDINGISSYMDSFYILATTGLKLHLIQNNNQSLNTSLSTTYEQNATDGKSYTPSTITTLENDYSGRANLTNGLNGNRTLEWLTNYSLRVGKHEIKALLGYSYQDFMSKDRSMTNSNFAYDDFLWNAIGSGSWLPEGRAGMSSDKSLYKLISIFGRANYSWKNLIMASASLRYEGSTKFGKNNKWGYFPAASVAWEMANMDFIKDNANIINSLKLRISYGVTGRSGFDSYKSIATYGQSGYYFMDDKWVNAFAPSRNPNPNLQWEKGVNTNLGLDFSLWKGRLSGSIDLFDRSSQDLLYNYTAPQPPMIYSGILVNVGTVQNRGLEVLFKGDIIKSNDFAWNSTFIYSTGKTYLKKLSNDIYGASYLDMYKKPGVGTTEYLFRYVEGGQIGQFYGYRNAGISNDGKLMVYDQNGNPIIKGLEKNEDKTFIGSGVPKAFLSWDNTLRYKKFDLNLFFRGALGFDIMNFYDYKMGFMAVPAENVLLRAYTDNVQVTGEPGILSSYHLQKGNYVKLENISFGYSTGLHNNYINKIRVFLAAKNVYTLTSYKGHDPSSIMVNGLTPGVDDLEGYPSAMELSLGLTINF